MISAEVFYPHRAKEGQATSLLPRMVIGDYHKVGAIKSKLHLLNFQQLKDMLNIKIDHVERARESGGGGVHNAHGWNQRLSKGSQMNLKSLRDANSPLELAYKK